MKINRLLAFTALTGSLIFSSCSSDDDFMIDSDQQIEEENPEEDYAYDNGVIILNEGAQSSGTISFIDAEFTTVENNIFETVNADMDLGQFLQSIFFDDENAYIIANGSNLITVVDRYTFEYVGQIDSDLNVPYYGVVYNGKAYVSNLAGFEGGDDDFVAVINLETLEVEETVLAGTFLDEVAEDDGLIYFEGASFGQGNSIKVFDPSNNTFTRAIATNDGLNSFKIDEDYIYALSSNQLQKIELSTGEEISVINFSEDFGSVSNLDVEDDNIYFTSGSSVYTVTKDATEAPEEALLSYENNSQYGTMYGFEVEDGFIYTSDGGDFSSNGTVRVYTISGDLATEFSAGVGPNGFYFND